MSGAVPFIHRALTHTHALALSWQAEETLTFLGSHHGKLSAGEYSSVRVGRAAAAAAGSLDRDAHPPVAACGVM